jgi:heterotetrameric sarcosine oxidase gamma subunit
MRHYEAQVSPLDRGVVAVEASAPALDRVAALFSVALPAGAASVAIADGLLHRSGPGSILVLTYPAAAEALAARLDAVLAEASAIVADLSDGHAWVEIAGPDWLDVLSQGVAIDLRETGLAPGQATRTLCFGVEVILVRHRPDVFRVGCRASYGPFLEARLRLAGDPLREAC